MSEAALRLACGAWLTLAVGCTCGEATPDRVAPAAAPVEADEPSPWTSTNVEGLELAGPATVVSVTSDAIEVDNAPLVDGWPAAGLANAREADPSDVDGWPRLSRLLRDPRVEERSIPALTEALTLARRIEAAPTGAPTGAGVYDLRVAPDAPFRWLDPVRYSASLAGYGSPRLRLDHDGVERLAVWPPAPRADARSIEAALAAFEAGDRIPHVADGAGSVRLEVRVDGVSVLREGERMAPGCRAPAPPDATFTYLPGTDSETVLACADALGGEPWTLAVDSQVRFGRVADLLVRLGARARPVRVLTR